MAAIESTDSQLSQVIAFVNNIIVFINGGPVAWYVGAAVAIIVAALFWRYNGQIRAWLMEASKRQSEKDEADNVKREQDAQDQWDKGAKATEDVVKANPDEAKKTHPAAPESLD